MSPGLVTQLVSEKPQVIVIADRLDVSMFRQAMTSSGLEVIEVSPSQVLEPGFEWSDATYKVVLFVTLSMPLDGLTLVAKKLAEAPYQVSVVILGITAIDDARPLFRDWQAASRYQERLLSQLNQVLPHVPLILAQDVVLETALLPVFKIMIQQLAHGTVVEPTANIYPQAWVSFSQNVASLIIKPGLESCLVKGKKVATATLAKLLQLYSQRVANTLPTVEVMAVKEQEINNGPTIDNFTAVSLDDVALKLVQLLPPQAKPQPRKLQPPDKQSFLRTSTTSQPVQPKPQFGRAAVSSPPFVASPPRPVSIPPRKITSVTKVVAAPSKPATDKPTNKQKPEITAVTKPVQPRQSLNQTEKPPVEIEAEVTRLFQTYRSDQKVNRVKNIATTTVKTTQKNKRKSWLFKGGVISAFLALLVVFLATGYFVSTFLLKQTVVAAVQNPSQALAKGPTIWAPLVKVQHQVYGQILDQTLFSQSEVLVNMAESWPEVVEKQQRLSSLTQRAYLQVTGRETGKVLDTTAEAVVLAQSLYELIAKNQAWLNEVELSDDPKVQSQISDYTEALNLERKSLLPIQQIQPLLAQLLGDESRRTYAILFQNPQELRPTGGFIQAVALVTFEDGVLINTQVISPYELDTSVPGVVEPPLDLKQLLGEQRWFFRDSNWQADFPATATQVTWFIEKGTNQSVDGVIGLNAYVVRDLLRVIGPVDLPEYNEVITDRNLFERLEFHSELQLVDPEKDYSTLLFNRVLQKMTNIAPDKAPEVMTVLRQNFEAKQMTMSLKNEAELLSLTNLGWSGALLQPACPAQLDASVCVVDTVAQVESNVGVNKANSYVERQIAHQVEVSPEAAVHHRVMTFTNTATSNAWPKGMYKNYLRLYVSPEAELTQVTINQTPLPLQQVVTKTETGKRVFGFLVEVPIQTTTTVEVDYTVPHSLSGEYGYALFNQQQPGITTPPQTIEFITTSKAQPSLIAPQAKVEGNKIIFNQLSLPHSFVGVVYR